jgi:hypothetical protein
MGNYNKPITTRVQQSSNLGMKVQDPLLNLGSPNKKALVGKQKNLPEGLKSKIEAAPETIAKYSADASLLSGAENSKFVDVSKAFNEGFDKKKKGEKYKEE